MTTYNLDKLVSIKAFDKDAEGLLLEFLCKRYKKEKKILGILIRKGGFYDHFSGYTPLKEVEKEIEETNGRLMFSNDKKDIVKSPRVELNFEGKQKYTKYFTMYNEAKKWAEEIAAKSIKNVLIV